MKTIKVIDLLNMISKGEKVPSKIHYGFDDYKLISYGYKTKIYQCLNKPYNVFSIKTDCLNDEVEIIEEKQLPEKLPRYVCLDAYNNSDINDNRKAINEIIDYLESKEKGE